MPSVKELKHQIRNIEKKLENETLIKRKARRLRQTLTRKRKQYNEIKPAPLRFSETMKIHEIPSGDRTPLTYYTVTTGNKPRYKRSLTRTKKVYKNENPYPEYLANRANSGKGVRSRDFKKKIQTILKEIDNSA